MGISSRPTLSWALPLMVLGCSAAPQFVADPSLLIDWSPAAQDRLPLPPYAARYERAGRSLLFVATRHEFDSDGVTCKFIEREVERFRPQVVVIEGLATALGCSPASYVASVERTRGSKRQPMGEAGFTAALATARGIPFWGGEPTDSAIHAALACDGIELRDLVYFFVVRQVPHWRRAEAGRQGSFGQFLARTVSQYRRTLSFDDDTLADPQDFLAWYAARNGHPFDLASVTSEECAPTLGPLFTNELSHRVGKVRDRHIVELIADLLGRHERVMVVYGAGHHVQQAQVLANMMGAPVALRSAVAGSVADRADSHRTGLR